MEAILVIGLVSSLPFWTPIRASISLIIQMRRGPKYGKPNPPRTGRSAPTPQPIPMPALWIDTEWTGFSGSFGPSINVTSK
jgi:hypothetical protein